MTAEQIAAAVEEIRERVRSRHEKQVEGLPDFQLPALDPLGHARDAAEAKAAAIGSVNPRRAGIVNDLVQSTKRTVARLLNWMVRGQVDFNRAVLRYMDQNIETAMEQNFALLRLAREFQATSQRLDSLTSGHKDLALHWNEWRPAWEERLHQAQIHFLHCLREAESAANTFASSVSKNLHADFQASLQRSNEEMQNHWWQILGKTKAEQERLIHTELRLIRRRASLEPHADGPPQSSPAQPSPAAANAAGTVVEPPWFDYARFEERFRGAESYVGDLQQIYLPLFKDCRRVIDLGCGRGEFLRVLQQAGVAAEGVDASPDAVAACKEKNLNARQGDLFEFLARQPDASVDGIFCAHVVEHLPPQRLPDLIQLAERKLMPRGVLAIETPNPACLAIFANDFYLDPTHLRPVPSKQLHFYLEEAGFTAIEVQEIHPASEVYPELAALDERDELRAFRRRFFGGLDYSIVGRKLEG